MREGSHRRGRAYDAIFTDKRSSWSRIRDRERAAVRRGAGAKARPLRSARTSARRVRSSTSSVVRQRNQCDRVPRVYARLGVVWLYDGDRLHHVAITPGHILQAYVDGRRPGRIGRTSPTLSPIRNTRTSLRWPGIGDRYSRLRSRPVGAISVGSGTGGLGTSNPVVEHVRRPGGDRDRERAAVRRDPGQEPPARRGEPAQVAVSRQHESRAAHSAQRHHRGDRDAARGRREPRSGPRAARPGARRGPTPAHPDQRRASTSPRSRPVGWSYISTRLPSLR